VSNEMNWYTKKQLISGLKIVAVMLIWLGILELIVNIGFGFTLRNTIIALIIYFTIVGIIVLAIGILVTALWLMRSEF
jgi:hypothetical protein